MKLHIFIFGIEQIVPDDNIYASVTLICVIVYCEESMNVLNTA